MVMTGTPPSAWAATVPPEGLLVYEIQGLAFQIVETVQILPVGAHGDGPGGGREADHGFKQIPRPCWII